MLILGITILDTRLRGCDNPRVRVSISNFFAVIPTRTRQTRKTIPIPLRCHSRTDVTARVWEHIFYRRHFLFPCIIFLYFFPPDRKEIISLPDADPQIFSIHLPDFAVRTPVSFSTGLLVSTVHADES